MGGQHLARDADDDVGLDRPQNGEWAWPVSTQDGEGRRRGASTGPPHLVIVGLMAERLDRPCDLLREPDRSAMQVRRIWEGATYLPDQRRMPLVQHPPRGE